MQGDIEKEIKGTPKVTVKNKFYVKPSGTSNQLKATRDSSGIRQESEPHTKSINSSRQPSSGSSSTSRTAKASVPKYGIEKKGAGGKVGGISEKQLVASPSPKTLPQSLGAKERGVPRRVSSIKESGPVLNKKLSEKSVPAPPRTGTGSIGKPSVLNHNRTVDKKDQNVKFKGGGSSSSPSVNPSSKSLRPKDGLKPPMLKGTEVRNSGPSSKANGVSSVKKIVGLVEKDGGKNKNSSLQSSVLKGNMKEKPDSRMKENLKRIMSQHVKKSKEENLKLDTQKAGKSMTVKPSENVGNLEESVSKRGRERTRTWTVSSSSGGNNTTECENNSIESGETLGQLKLSSVLDMSSQRREGGNELSAERATSTIHAHTVGTSKNILEAKASTSSNVSVSQSDNGKSFKIGAKEQGAKADENADKETGFSPGGVVDEYEYEDDFEDYESDFEEYTDDDEEGTSVLSSDESKHSGAESDESHDKEVESAAKEDTVKNIKNDGTEVEGASSMKEDEEDCERKMDSGLYDSGRKKRPEEDFSPRKLSRVDADEGFDEREEEAKSQHEKWEVSVKDVAKPVSFCTSYEVFFTKKSPLEKEVTKKALERGRKLLQMITLDEMSFSLFELPSIPYDAFMKCRGHINTKQISTQTNEDSHSEGSQTDSILMVDAWTQKPPVISLSLKESTESHPQLLDNSSWIRLGRFMESAGEVMSILLEEQWNNCTFLPKGSSVNSPLSKITFKLGQSGSSDTLWEVLLASRPVVCVCFCKTRSNLLLCCHGPPKIAQEKKIIQLDEAVGNNLEVGSQSSLLSVWSVSEPSCPYKLLCCQGVATRACFQEGISDFGQILLAGSEDGSICVWDMYERGGSYVEIPFLERGSKKALCPMFTTHGDETHLGRIVGLEPILGSEFGDVDGEKTSSSRAKIANQVCSLDEWGVILVWSVIRRGGSKKVGWVSIVPSMKVCLAETNWNKSENSLFTDCESSLSERLSGEVNDVSLWNALAVDSDWILAASDTGSVVCLPVDGEQRSMKVYPGSKDSLASAESIVVNPQGLPFFMVGNFVGQVHLFSHSSKRHFGSWEPPPLSLPSAIVKLAWSPQRPFVFFTVDSLSRIHIWDLASSDIFPLASLPSPKVGKITDISLSFPKGNSPGYMAVGMDNGEVVLHHLREELTSSGHEVRRKELSQFIKYANLL